MAMKEKLGAPEVALCPTLNNLGVSYLQLNNLALALEYSLQSLKIAERNNLLNRQKEALENIAAIYIMAEDYKNALHYKDLLQSVQGKITNQENLRKNFEIERKYQEELRIRQAEVEQDALMHRLEAEYSTILALTVTCLLIIAVLGKIRISRKYYRALTFLALLLFFEAIMVINDRIFDKYMDEQPIWALAINFTIALLFVPINGFLQKRLSKIIPDQLLKPASITSFGTKEAKPTMCK